MTGPSNPLSGFLRGIRILDLTQYIPGPMASLFLADMGAEVVKIEPPTGDEMQRIGPRDQAGNPIFYEALNAGKTAIRLNLKDMAERDLFYELVRGADVVIEGFRPTVLQRLGADWPVLSKINPRLIMCSISGFGAVSPLRDVAGHDGNYLALHGVMSRNGETQPAFYDPPVADIGGALFAAMSILGALHGRNRVGTGCAIDLALADTMMPMQMMQIADFGANGTVPRPGGTYLNGGAAYYQVYHTADRRHVMLGAMEPKFWRNFCDAAGRPDLVARQSEAIPQHSLKADVAEIIARLTLDENRARFGSVDCCFSVVNDLEEALKSDHVAARRLVRTDPSGQLQALYPGWFDGAPPELRTALAHSDARQIIHMTPRSDRCNEHQ